MLAPSRIGRFVVLRELGAGAMGVVYAAYDAKLDRRLAIKVLSDKYPGEHELGTSRLEREAQALARLSHPNVVQIYEVGPIEGGIYIAMELVHGRTLREWLADAPRDWRAVLAVFMQVGAGLQAAHASGVVHRDIKPDNIVVGADGRARVLDFSLAAPIDRQAELDALGDMRVSSPLLTQDGGFVGTPAYMSPEQFLGTPTDARSDQFQLLRDAVGGALRRAAVPRRHGRADPRRIAAGTTGRAGARPRADDDPPRRREGPAHRPGRASPRLRRAAGRPRARPVPHAQAGRRAVGAADGRGGRHGAGPAGADRLPRRGGRRRRGL
ncbi:serine/threonine-protein kinase [Nannocystis pusilla]|uniref:serine/threonine-protein kinase n=1 Tax=Nannocystis pusilla TaxID=889268 RepID=UPI003DA640EC